MTDKEKIKRIKIKNKNKYNNLTNDEVILTLIDLLKKNDIEPLVENIVVLAFLQFPERFQLLGYPSYPDSGRVQYSLLHLGKHGKGLLLGSRGGGFDFSEKGKNFLIGIFKDKKRQKGYDPISPIKTKETRILNLIKLSPAFKKFKEGKNKEIIEYEVRNLLRATNTSTNEYLLNNLETYMTYADKLNEKIILEFLKIIKKNWSSLFIKPKIRSKNE